jgi:hypothetical protein
MTDILSIARQFDIGDVDSITPYGKGRINETFLVTKMGMDLLIISIYCKSCTRFLHLPCWRI